MARRDSAISLKLLGTWGLMLVYWVGTALNIHRYFAAVSRDGNYDSYIVYLYRAAWLNFPIRSLNELFHVASSFSPVDELATNVGGQPLATFMSVSWEIVLLDCLAGSCFWLLVLQIATAVLLGRSSGQS